MPKNVARACRSDVIVRATIGLCVAWKPEMIPHAIVTKGAVLKAVAAPRDIDIPMVDAQQARRILDRIVGYMVSPVLWRNVRVSNAKTLSAGRVQSVALRLLVERQREIDSFKPETYYLMGAIAKKRGAGNI